MNPFRFRIRRRRRRKANDKTQAFFHAIKYSSWYLSMVPRASTARRRMITLRHFLFCGNFSFINFIRGLCGEI